MGPSLKMHAGFPDGDLRICRRQTVGHAVGPNHGQLRRASSRMPCPIFATARFLSTLALYSPPFAFRLFGEKRENRSQREYFLEPSLYIEHITQPIVYSFSFSVVSVVFLTN